jgi:hypothetical protein
LDSHQEHEPANLSSRLLALILTFFLKETGPLCEQLEAYVEAENKNHCNRGKAARET